MCDVSAAVHLIIAMAGDQIAVGAHSLRKHIDAVPGRRRNDRQLYESLTLIGVEFRFRCVYLVHSGARSSHRGARTAYQLHALPECFQFRSLQLHRAFATCS